MATTTSERILTLDVIRGIAVMGIFSVNVVGMAMIERAYFYPPDYGFDSTGDRVMWALNSIFVDGRFRALFSILFGASLTVVVERAVAAGRKGWQVHYPRMIVLLLFGLAHYYLLWWGDILANYALVGMIAYVFWRLRPKWLLLAAVVALLLGYVPQLVGGMGQIAKVEAGLAPDAPPELRAKVERMLAPSPTLAQEIAEDKADHASIAAHLGASTEDRGAALRPFMSVPGYGLETLGLMLIGMALFKSGMLTGQWEPARYRRWAIRCFAIAVPALLLLTFYQVASGYDGIVIFATSLAWSLPFDVIMTIGWAALIMLVAKRHSSSSATARVGAAGRMAFTNYLMTSIVMTTIFYGYGLALYGEVGRAALYLFVIGMWAAMLLWSKPWLDRFHYGPLEWLWRSLSRFKPQPMRKQHSNVAIPAGA